MSGNAPKTNLRLKFGPWTAVVWPVGRKGLFSSAAAGVSLVAASLVLVIGVSALIGFRGFRSARSEPTSQSVVLQPRGADQQAGGAATTAPVVIGGTAKAVRRQGAARSASRRGKRSARRTTSAKVQPAPSRSGLSAPSAAEPAPAAESDPGEERAPNPSPVVPDTKSPPATPVDQVVEDLGDAVDDVEKPVESVGDVLLDLRDALP